jgi:hypothetical protein
MNFEIKYCIKQISKYPVLNTSKYPIDIRNKDKKCVQLFFKKLMKNHSYICFMSVCLSVSGLKFTFFGKKICFSQKLIK